MSGPEPRRDYYRILQIDPGAHPEIVRAAYRTLLRVLGRHPDLGGSHDEAATLNEAYAMLSDAERRHAYDVWLAAHGRAALPEPMPLPSLGITHWIRSVLSDHRAAPNAPFAHNFDYVLEGPGPWAPRVYVKHYPLINPAQWPMMVILLRAVAVARRGLMPSIDVVLFVAETVERGPAFLAEAARHSAGWSWNRCYAALCSASPPCLHVDLTARLPAALRRLKDAAGGETA